MTTEYPALVATALDSIDARALAEFYRELLGYTYASGDEPPGDNEEDEAGWLVLEDRQGNARLAFQQVEEMARSTWPDPKVPQQMHLDLTVPDLETLIAQKGRATSLGASVLDDRSDDEADPLIVFADPEHHPFCIISTGRWSPDS